MQIKTAINIKKKKKEKNSYRDKIIVKAKKIMICFHRKITKTPHSFNYQVIH